ncbi:MAG: glycerol-3-phosphate 1-O-acyltransferase PlsY [Candidatus Gastranaerophilaceae bacterium]
MHVILWIVGLTFLAYFIGSFPTGFLLVKFVKGIDIREIGSGSTGATNVKRILGKKGFWTVMLIDCFKGLLPVLFSKYLEVKLNLYPNLSILPVLVSIAIIIGHSKSIFLGFKGGKSVACGSGTIMGLNLSVGLITFVIWSTLTYTTKYVSIGSIVALLLTSVWMYFFKQPVIYIIYCFMGSLYIIWLHRENIKRLLNGTESKVRN